MRKNWCHMKSPWKVYFVAQRCLAFYFIGRSILSFYLRQAEKVMRDFVWISFIFVWILLSVFSSSSPIWNRDNCNGTANNGNPMQNMKQHKSIQSFFKIIHKFVCAHNMYECFMKVKLLYILSFSNSKLT